MNYELGLGYINVDEAASKARSLSQFINENPKKIYQRNINFTQFSYSLSIKVKINSNF